MAISPRDKALRVRPDLSGVGCLALLLVPGAVLQVAVEGRVSAILQGNSVIGPGDGLWPPPLLAYLPQVLYGGHSESSPAQGQGDGPLLLVLLNAYGRRQVQGSNWTSAWRLSGILDQGSMSLTR